MLAGKHSIPIYKTKLHRPRVARDFMLREALDVLLDHSPDHPLILVSAPAGYGKSSVVSHWLETRGHLNAWLSLDEVDSEVRVFLTYLVAAVNTVFPDACAETAVQLLEETLPPLPELAGCLGNDLDALEKPFVLVLDDYHQIGESAVHELLNHLLKHPPRSLQLLVISRWDPPFLLGALRAHSKVTEVRARDLMFTHAETRAFLEQATDRTFSSAAIAHLHQINEGWVVGLRLAVLALQHHKDVDAFLLGFDCDVSGVQNFLLEEVLSTLTPSLVDRICATSILNRFCAPLCEAVGSALAEEDEDPFDGSAFLKFLQDSGLFCVSLDEHGKWFRYHHLFQELLQRRLRKRSTSEEIASLHHQAAKWFEAQDLLEEAITHTQIVDGPPGIGRLLIRHRNAILNEEQWYLLNRSLKRLPAETVQNDPDLLILIVWRMWNQGLYLETRPILDRIEKLMSDAPSGSGASMYLQGAISALRSYHYYNKGEADLALKCAEQALTQLPPDNLSERGYALTIKVGALRTSGDTEGARKVIFDALADTSAPTGKLQARLLMALCIVNWTSADLPSMQLAARRFLKLSEELGLEESTMSARYLLGSVQYQQNQLSQAETSLLPVVSSQRVPNEQYFAESAFALASVYQARGQTEKARETVESACERLLEYQQTFLLQRAQAFQADLCLRQGRISEAVRWSQQCDLEPIHNNYRFYEPQLTLARVHMAQGSVKSQRQADSLLNRLETFYERTHNTRFLIEVLALRAMFHDQKGEEPAALLALGRGVNLAQPGGFIRLFTDLGPRIVDLLNRLDLDAEGLGYVQRIMNVYQDDVKTEAGEVLEHPLSKRELEILRLLAKQLTNPQIADRLFIAPGTVKRHTENIYKKLDVSSRHQAVTKAKELAIILSD
jgi:LuxR family maltose regulon positive regulatory protein